MNDLQKCIIIKLFSSSSQLSMKCILLINVKSLSAISSDENNVDKHTTFCDVRKLFEDRSKSTKCKVMFLTSNKIEYR